MLSCFIAYSHKDEGLKSNLVSHLSALRRLKKIDIWHDRRVFPGQKWEGAIDKHLNDAHIILLLISADFIESEYCYTIETSHALRRHESGEAVVIPVILQPCDWEHLSIGALQALPKFGKAVTTWANLDEALTDIASSIRSTVDTFSSAGERSREATKEKTPSSEMTRHATSAATHLNCEHVCRDCGASNPTRCTVCAKCFECLGINKSGWRKRVFGDGYFCDNCSPSNDGSNIACN